MTLEERVGILEAQMITGVLATGLCSAHRYPTDPTCRICYPLPKQPAQFSVKLMRAFAAGQWAMGPMQVMSLVTEAANEIDALREALRKALNVWDNYRIYCSETERLVKAECQALLEKSA